MPPTSEARPARSEDAIFAPGGPTIPLVLGGVEKPIRQLPVRRNEAWKRELASALATKLSGPAAGGIDSVESLSALFTGAQDLQIELLLAYDVEGRIGGRDWLEDNATPAEIWAAFKEVLYAAFPFLADARRTPAIVGQLLEQLPRLVAPRGNPPSPPGA